MQAGPMPSNSMPGPGIHCLLVSTASWHPGRYLGIGAPCVDVASFNVYLEDAAAFKKYMDRLQV